MNNDIQSASKLINPQRLHRCKVLQLRKIAKRQGISKTERMKREELLSALHGRPRNYTLQRATLIHHRMTIFQKQQLLAATKIAKWWRYWKQIRQMEDPITLDTIHGQPFIFVSKNPPYAQYTFGADFVRLNEWFDPMLEEPEWVEARDRLAYGE